jgi:uncharacterized membrane protein YoaK (UPF0700 family)
MIDNLEKIKKLWSKLTPIEAFYISLLARLFIVRKKIKETHPKKLAVPMCILEICILTISAITTTENIITIFSVSIFISIGIAIAPTLIKRKKFHWI